VNTTTTTPQLINVLVERAAPVRRLRPPLVRAGLWLGFAGVVLAVFAVCHGVRTHIGPSLAHPAFALTIAAALATGMLAAVAAFVVSIPDRSRLVLLLPAPALAVWIGTIGYGCIADWVSVGPDGLQFGETLECFATMALTSIPLAIALAVMLQYAALLRTGAVAMMGGLAIAAITSAVHGLLHGVDASVMILIWNLGTAVLITAIAGLLGGGLFAWFEARLNAPLGGAAPR
jgi:hypothetical protein